MASSSLRPAWRCRARGRGLHGRRVGPPHRARGGLPGDARDRARRTWPPASPTRTSTARRSWRSPVRPAATSCTRSPTSTWTSSRRSAVHEVEHAGRDRRGDPRGGPQGLQGRRVGEARGLPHRGAGGRGRGEAEGAPLRRPSRAAPRPIGRRCRARRILNRGGAPADLRRQRRHPRGASRSSAFSPSARRSRSRTTFMAKGAPARRRPAAWSRPSAWRASTSIARLRQGRRHRGRGLRSGGVRPGLWNPAGKPASSTSTSPPPRSTATTSRRSRLSPTCARRSSSWRGSSRCRSRAPFAAPAVILDELEEGADDDAFPLKPAAHPARSRAAMGGEDLLISTWAPTSSGWRAPSRRTSPTPS